MELFFCHKNGNFGTSQAVYLLSQKYPGACLIVEAVYLEITEQS